MVRWMHVRLLGVRLATQTPFALQHHLSEWLDPCWVQQSGIFSLCLRTRWLDGSAVSPNLCCVLEELGAGESSLSTLRGPFPMY